MSRISDTPGRWGGEEFLIVVPQTNRDSAVAFAEKLRLSIENTEFSGGVRVSASFGVASFQPGETIPVVLQRADEALYRAKKLGRNRIETDVAS